MHRWVNFIPALVGQMNSGVDTCWWSTSPFLLLEMNNIVVRNPANQILYETHYQTLFVPLTAYLRKYKL